MVNETESGLSCRTAVCYHYGAKVQATEAIYLVRTSLGCLRTMRDRTLLDTNESL